MTGDDFLQQRSEQILKRLTERTPAFAAFAKRRNGMKTLSLTLPILALLLGAGLDRITDPHRVDLLSAPLLLIIAWNLLVYIGLFIWLFIPSHPLGWPKAGLVRHLSVGKLSMPRKLPHVLATGLLNLFGGMGAPEPQADLRPPGPHHPFERGPVCHRRRRFVVCARLSVAICGRLGKYFPRCRPGAQPAVDLVCASHRRVPLQGFSLAEIEALRFPQTTAAEGGARWVHLYAATIFLLVVLPRVILAVVANLRAMQLAKKFPLDLDQPYFRKLNDSIGVSTGGLLRVLPYSFTVDEARHKGLGQIATMLFGEQGRVMLRPSTSYGEEPKEVLRDTDLNDAQVNITAVLFNLTATPEKENHGAFLTIWRNRRRAALPC